jgi:hypothetical protein
MDCLIGGAVGTPAQFSAAAAQADADQNRRGEEPQPQREQADFPRVKDGFLTQISPVAAASRIF